MRFAFAGQIVEWRGPAPYYFVAVPHAVSAEIRELAAAVTYGWGAIPVEVSIGGAEFSTSLFPKHGRYLLPLRGAVRKSLGIDVDDEVTVEMQLHPRHP